MANAPWMDYPDTDPVTLSLRKEALYRDAPVHPVSDLLAWKSTVVFAPHADDESLGCGGLIRHLRALGREVAVVFVTDGGMSHPGSIRFDHAARVALRRQEALAACAHLSVAAERVAFLELPDGNAPFSFAAAFPDAVDRMLSAITAWRPDTFVVPWRRDPHEDHRATWEMCRAAKEALNVPLRWIEYPVWMWEARNLVDLPRPDEVITWSLEVGGELTRKEAAIRAHRSQWSGIITDDPSGFQLPEAMLSHFLRPREIFFALPEKRLRSLDRRYFDAVYAEDTDPWNFETSEYEKAKYAATLAALPKRFYLRALEVGCSIGVLTALLAPRCGELLAVDIAPRPLEAARKRLEAETHVRFSQMQIPGQFPAGRFDLIVVSEVGYYWNYPDLEKAVECIRAALVPGGTLVLVHYTPYVPDYPLTGDEVHDTFTLRLEGAYHVTALRTDRYRLDVWKAGGTPVRPA